MQILHFWFTVVLFIDYSTSLKLNQSDQTPAAERRPRRPTGEPRTTGLEARGPLGWEVNAVNPQSPD